jgi:exodeoxyribonuclease I
MAQSMFWYDFETTGVDPIRDRPVQFAGVRTDLNLNLVEPPVNVFCAVGHDVVPSPEAIQVTGLSMLDMQRTGICETEFCRRVLSCFSEADTCVAGYNSIRFDDEFTRQMCYRNFQDPYAREWQQGNSRWDVIDLFRMAYALRPQGVDWPADEEGVPSFRLELLTAANGIAHGDAHDAVSDVIATIELTKLLKARQPRLYQYLFNLRQKKAVLKQLYPLGKSAVIHVSSMYSARQSCLAVILPICSHPTNSNGVICVDLSSDVDALLHGSADEIARRVFTSSRDLAEGEQRIQLKTIHVNRSPAIAPLATMSDDDASRLGIDLPQCQATMKQIQTTAGLVERVTEAFSSRTFPQTDDPDAMLYQGGFFSPADTTLMAQIHLTEAAKLDEFSGRFDDARLDEMLFRYRGRNFPASLNSQEQQRWRQFCRERWEDGAAIDSAIETLEQLDPHNVALQDLKKYLKDISIDVLAE